MAPGHGPAEVEVDEVMAKRFDSATKKAILADYLAGTKIASIAAQYGCHESYPGVLAQRSGNPQRVDAITRGRMADRASDRSLYIKRDKTK